ncbi:MAG TPA: NlpC/P60 family protein, partial [Microthrixaceae bacterium]|nr:NlpC/P60 family protein [Microthrixaceae bacterium]
MNRVLRQRRRQGSTFLILAIAIAAAGCAPPPGPAAPAVVNNPEADRSPAGCPAGPSYEACERSVTMARSDTSARALKFAFQQVGKPYSTAGRLGPDGYDCSGLVWRAYSEAGVEIGAQTSATIIVAGRPRTAISMDQVLPGDIVWYPGHVAIALADGFILEAAKPGTNVRVVSSKYRDFSRA